VRERSAVSVEQQVKLGVAGIVAVLASACCSSPPCNAPPHTDDPALTLTPADQRTACRQAGAKLEELKCKEARVDFVDFCLNALEGGIPIRPLCLATITTCTEVDRCRH
jgi:hypothetical protein